MKEQMIKIKIGELIVKLIFKETLKSAFKRIVDLLKPTTLKLNSSEENIEFAIETSLKKGAKWAVLNEGINLSQEKPLDEVFIDLDFYLTPREEHIDFHDTKEKIIDNVFNETDKHIVILGEAGAGKSTSMKMIAKKMLTKEDYLDDYKFPLIVQFREIGMPTEYHSENRYHLTKYLQNELALFISLTNDNDEREVPLQIIKKIVYSYIDSLNCLLILDGFDEIPFWQQKNVISEIDQLSQSLNHSRIILTLRTANFNFFPINFRKFELSPLKPLQILNFSKKWLGDNKGAQFYDKAMKSPFRDTISKPLILTYLINLYKVNENIPELPNSLFQQILDILLFKWDKGRTINRPSKFENFEYDNKSEFLSHLAFKLLSKNLTNFSNSDLERIYTIIQEFFPYLPKNPTDVITEIREHSGIIIKMAFDTFTFPHKSLQEYLAGKFIAGYNPLDEIMDEVLNMPYEAAIATNKASNPTNFLITITENLKNKSLDSKNYLDIYIKRLLEHKSFFIAREKLGYTIVNLWVNYYNDSPVTDSYEFNLLVNIDGIRESLRLLQNTYKVDAGLYIDSERKSNPNALVIINKRKYSFQDDRDRWNFKFKVPVLFVRDWKFLQLKI